MRPTSSLLLFLFLLNPAIFRAQSLPNRTSRPAPADTAAVNKAKADKEAEAERIRNERRANARALLVALAADAGKFNDAVVRARTLARVAFELWESDRERARTMFRSAWDSAVIADQEFDQKAEDESRRPPGAKGGADLPSPPEVRKEVLRLAARRDRALSEEFLTSLKEQSERENGKPKSSKKSPLGNFDAVSIQRLDLARQVLADGQTERAILLADPVLNVANQWTMNFLSDLRGKNDSAADDRYAALLGVSIADPQSDANTVLAFASYLFTPYSYIFFGREGTYTNSSQGNLTPPSVAPALRQAFFRAAASILLRPLAPPGQEQNSAGHDGHYLTIKRLLPLFEQNAGPELTAAIRGQLENLSSLVTKGTRDRDDDDWVRKQIRPDNMLQNWEQSLRDQLDRAKTPEERDQINYRLAELFAGKGDLQARDYVDRIDQSEMRAKARTYIDMRLGQDAVAKRDLERMMELTRNGQLPHLYKVRLLTNAARLLAKSDNEKAQVLLDLATSEARRISASDADSPRAFLAVANGLLSVNPTAVWDGMGNVVKAANTAEGFSGEDGQINFSMVMKSGSWSYHENVLDFDLKEIIQQLAELDYDKAAELVHGFTRESPRATATLAFAQAVLHPKKK